MTFLVMDDLLLKLTGVTYPLYREAIPSASDCTSFPTSDARCITSDTDFSVDMFWNISLLSFKK